MKFENKKGIVLRGLSFGAMALVFLMVYSMYTSPLTAEHGGDSAFFILVGQGMTRGMLPYRDFFDMKGPYLFLIEYIGQLICYGRTGAFIMQWLNLTVCLWIMGCTYRMMSGNKKSSLLKEALLAVPVLLIAAFTFEGGNLTEEFSLPWLLLALYFALRYFRRSDADGNWEHPLWEGFYYGLAFGVLALIRVTNAALIGAVILTIAIGLLAKKEWVNLLLNGAVFILGCAAAFAPMCVYYACHGLLGEMLNQVFLFGVQYSSEVGFSTKLVTFLQEMKRCILWNTVPVLVLAVCGVKNWRYWIFAVSSVGLVLIAAVMGNGYLHYMTLGLPNVVLGLSLLMEQTGRFGKLRMGAAAAVLALILALQWPLLAERTTLCLTAIDRADHVSATQTAVEDITAHVPEADRDSVYIYGPKSCSNWYARAGLLPSHRYCDWQEHYIQLNPGIGEELAAWLQAEGTAWLVIPTGYSGLPEGIAQAVTDCYQEVARNEMYILYGANSNT